MTPTGRFQPPAHPRPPDGRANNWLQTAPGKGFFVILRLCNPLQPFFDNTCRPSEIESIIREERMLSQSSAPAAATAIRPEITTPDSVATDQKAGGSSPSERAQLTGPSQTKMSFLALDSSVFEGSSQLIRPSNVRRRRRPVSKRICLFSVRSMARLVRFGCIRDADELPDRNAESDDRDHQSSQADPVPRLHLHRLLSRDLREGKLVRSRSKQSGEWGGRVFREFTGS